MPEVIRLRLDLGSVEWSPGRNGVIQSGDAFRSLLFDRGEVAPNATRVENVLPAIDVVGDREHPPFEDGTRR